MLYSDNYLREENSTNDVNIQYLSSFCGLISGQFTPDAVLIKTSKKEER